MNKQNLHIRAVRREPVDLDRLVTALLALAEQLQAESETDNEAEETTESGNPDEAES